MENATPHPGLILAGLQSGSGKTAITCMLLASLVRRGVPVQPFKVGPDYIETAFRTAAEADPSALLVYNDNHLEYDVREDNNRRATLLGLLKRLVANKVPIGAL